MKMIIEEIGRYEYNQYTFIILEQKTTDYQNKPFSEYFISVDPYADIKYLYGVPGGISSDDVWNYITSTITDNYETVDDYITDLFEGGN